MPKFGLFCSFCIMYVRDGLGKISEDDLWVKWEGYLKTCDFFDRNCDSIPCQNSENETE